MASSLSFADLFGRFTRDRVSGAALENTRSTLGASGSKEQSAAYAVAFDTKHFEEDIRHAHLARRLPVFSKEEQTRMRALNAQRGGKDLEKVLRDCCEWADVVFAHGQCFGVICLRPFDPKTNDAPAEWLLPAKLRKILGLQWTRAVRAVNGRSTGAVQNSITGLGMSARSRAKAGTPVVSWGTAGRQISDVLGHECIGRRVGLDEKRRAETCARWNEKRRTVRAEERAEPRACACGCRATIVLGPNERATKRYVDEAHRSRHRRATKAKRPGDKPRRFRPMNEEQPKALTREE